MTLDRAAFARVLPGAVGGGTCRREEDGFSGEAGAGRWRIRLSALPAFHLGPVALERLRVDLELEGFSAPQAEAFIDRFQVYFQRGGG
jgi:hypothetical protein